MNPAQHRDFETDSPTLNTGAQFSQYRQFRLEVIGGPDQGAVLVSSDLRVSVGRDASADLVLSDPSVAAYQFEIVAKIDRIDIADLSGDHSTLVNDLEVARAHLVRPVVISVGQTTIRFEPMSSSLHVRRSSESRFSDLVGNSTSMRDLFVELQSAAACDAPILLSGEAGVGKERVARAIHDRSARCDHGFFIVDCTVGHKQVECALVAAFESEAGGTIYLSQVGELSFELQSRLLRVFRTGGPVAVSDLRIICSSTVDLRRAVNEGIFDPRLYGFVSATEAAVPSLREREGDIPALVRSLLEDLDVTEKPVAASLCTSEFFHRLARHGWPGNVRELREYLRCCVQQGGDRLVRHSSAAEVASLPLASSPEVDISRSIKLGREEWIKHFERMYLADILESVGGNVTRAAKAAGVDRGHFYRLMMRSGLRN